MAQYRFTIQWQDDTPEKKRIGEYLTTLGRKKSDIIVEALAQFLDNKDKAENKDKALVLLAAIEEIVKTYIDNKCIVTSDGSTVTTTQEQDDESNGNADIILNFADSLF